MARLRSVPLALTLLPLWAAAAPNPWGNPVDELLSSARLWDMKGREDLARLALQKLLHATPGDRVARARLAAMDARAGKLPLAQAEYQRLTSDGPVGPNIRSLAANLRVLGPERQQLSQARLLARSGRVDEAARAMRTLFPKGPPDGPLLLEYLRVVGATPAGWAEARAGYARLARDYPQEPEFRFRLAALLAQRPDTRATAIGTLAEMARLQRGNVVDVMAAWRRALLSTDEATTSPQRYREYLLLDPKDKAMGEQLARAEAAEAERYRRLHDPNEIALARALAALDAEHLDVAAEGLQVVATQLPKDGRVLGGLGSLALKRGDDAQAEQYFREALANDATNRSKWLSLIDTAHYWGLIKRGNAARDAGHYDEAEGLIRQALAMQPQETNGLAALARVALARGRLDEADQGFIGILKQVPDNRLAWQGRVDVALARGRSDEARKLIAAALHAEPTLATTLAPIQASLARQDADTLVAAGRLADARLMLEAALLKAPDEVWLRYDLARVLTRLGKPSAARAAMQGAAPLVRNTMPWRYADALVLAGLQEWDDAALRLDGIPEAERDDAIRRLMRDVRVRAALADAADLAEAGRTPSATAAIDRAERAAGDDLGELAAVVDAWQQQGHTDQATQLARRALAAQTQSDAATIIASAELAEAANLDGEVATRLSLLATTPMNSAQQSDRDALRTRLIARQAGALLKRGDAIGAQHLLREALKREPSNERLQGVLADAYEAGGDIHAALTLVQQRVASQANNADLRLDLARLYAALGQRAAAKRELEAALRLAADDDVETRLGAVRRLTALNERAKARAVLSKVAQTRPDDARVVLQEGRLTVAEGHYDDAMSLFERAASDPAQAAPAQQEMESLYQRTAPYAVAAAQRLSKSGVGGVSTVNQWEAPVEVRWADGLRARWFVQVDPVRIDAGSLPAANPSISDQFGSLNVAAPQGLASTLGERARGAAIGVGWQSDSLRGDIGTTPLGFPVVDVVGGVRWSSEHDWGDTRLALSRRPLTSSVLTFAGARDPTTGEVWGGVRSTGLDARWSFDAGRMSYSANMGAHLLTGRNVARNQELDMRLAASRTLLDHPNAQLSGGVALTYWQYQQDLSNYTFGQGGYYSPQSYASLTLPFDYAGRAGRWAWEMRGSVGESISRTKSMPWYPTRPQLEAAAGDPVFQGGPGHGFSHSFKSAIEYRAAPGLRVGLEGSIDRSAYYAPNYLGFYLRYDLGKPSEPPRFPDNPLTAYTQF